MGWHLGTIALGAMVVAVGFGPEAAAAQKAPPAPPTKVRQFPKPTSPPPVPRVIRLKPGQKVITAAQLRNAPTVYEVNKRGKSRVSKPLTQPSPVRVPGAPPILRDLPLPDSKPPTPVPVTRKPATKRVPKK